MARKRKRWEKKQGGMKATGRRSTKRGLQSVDGKRRKFPDVDVPLTPARRPDLKHLPWKTIEALFCAGVSAVEIAIEYPPSTVAAIEMRAKRGNWMTPALLKRKALAMIGKSEAMARQLCEDGFLEEVVDDPIDALALRIAEGTLEHKGNILDEVGRSMNHLKDSKPLKIRTVSDLDKVDKMARRTLGLDDEANESKFMININAHAVAPIEVVDV